MNGWVIFGNPPPLPAPANAISSTATRPSTWLARGNFRGVPKARVCILGRQRATKFVLGVGPQNSGVGPRGMTRFGIPDGGHFSGWGETPDDGKSATIIKP